MTTKYDHYSMVVQWSIPDNIYIVAVPELSGCKTHGDTYEEAIKQAQEVIELWIDANEEWGRTIPEPKVIGECMTLEVVLS